MNVIIRVFRSSTEELQPTRFKEQYLMVERGIIKVYFGSKSHNKGRFGFIRVTGEDGQPTGEEVYFHLNQARRPEITAKPSGLGKEVHFSAVRAGLGYLDGEPRKGDFVVFEAEAGSLKRRTTAWTTDAVWDEFKDEPFWDAMPKLDESDFQSMCPGDCGQPESSCTCAELASFRSHNSMTDGYWTA